LGLTPIAAGDVPANETDPVFTAWDKSTGISITASQVSDFPTNVSTFNNDSGYLTSVGGSVCASTDTVTVVTGVDFDMESTTTTDISVCTSWQ
jgi:hypothetical protein